MEKEDLNPRGEYSRVCPYCNEEFTATHMNRDFCPEKNGRKDWCKNRYKRIARHDKQGQPMVEEYYDLDELNGHDINGSLVLKNVTQQVANISLIGATLGDNDFLKLPNYYLQEKGVVYSAFDLRYPLPGTTDQHVLIFGPYAIAWGYDNYIILTHKNNIQWIQ